MIDEVLPPKSNSEEIAAAEKMGREFLQKIVDTPERDRQPLMREKFADPIAQTILDGHSLDAPNEIKSEEIKLPNVTQHLDSGKPSFEFSDFDLEETEAEIITELK